LDRITGITIAGKSFYFNKNRTKSGVAYLTIVAKKSNTPKSDEEKMVLFDSQIPSFMHKMLEAYSDICETNNVPLFMSVKPSQIAGVELPEPVEEVEEFHCPGCGTGVYDPNEEFSGYLWVQKLDAERVSVKCKQCGWHPESKTVNETNGAVFHRVTEEGVRWTALATW